MRPRRVIMRGRWRKSLAQLSGAALVLGSATPSVEAYFKTEDKTYRLFTLAKRAKTGSEMAAVEVVDLRKEMENGNKSIFSERLQELIRDRLEKKSRSCCLSTGAAIPALSPAEAAARL